MEPSAELLDPTKHYVVAEQGMNLDYEVLHPKVIISFSGLCLCLCPEDDGSAWWWMGQLDGTNGSTACWAAYA